MRSALLTLAILAACADPGPPPSDTPPAAPILPAAATAEAAEDQAVGVGAQAPDFTLPDAEGDSLRLADLLIDGPVVLTFYRGAWCPYCNTQLRDYERSYDRVRAAGAQLVAVSPQAADGTAEMDSTNALSFPVLSDVGNEVSRRYGLVFEVDDETRGRYEIAGVDLAQINGTDRWELPVPGTYVIDRAGTVRAAFVESDYTQRASARQVLDALADIL